MSLPRLTEIMDNNCSIAVSAARTANTTAYDAGDVIGNATTSIITFSNITNNTGSHLYIVGARLKIAVNAVPSGMGSFKLHLYNASPTNIADGAAFNLPSGDLAKYLGYITFGTPEDLGDNIIAQVDNINKKLKLTDGSQTLYSMLQTVAGYTPTSAAVKTIELEIVGC